MKPKAEILAQLESADDGNYILRTEAEENEFRENLLKTELDKKIGARIKEVHTSYDNDLYELTGKRRKDDEPTYDFMKRHFSELKEKADSTILLENQIKELNTKIRDGSGDETLKRQLKSYEQKHNDALKEWTREKEELQGKFNTYRVDAALDNSLAGLKFRADLPEAVVKSYIDSVKSDLRSKAILQDDQLVFKNGEDGILVDNTTLKPISAASILNDKLKDILAGDGVKGLGGGKDNEKPKGEIVPPDSALVSNEELTKWLLNEFAVRKGLTKNAARNDPEYLKIFKEYSKK